MKKRNWYAITAQQTASGVVAEVRIYDEIGFWGVTAKDFISQLDAAASSAASVVVAINSPGGDVFDAFAIFNALRRYSGRVTTRVDGVAASAASLVLMAGDNIIMPANAMLMIHDPSTIAAGNSTDLRSAADAMDKIGEGIVAAYANRSGQSTEDVIKMMQAETWLTATEAKALGFADEIEEPVKLQASASAGAYLARFDRVPQAFMDEIEEADPSPVTSVPVDPPAGKPVVKPVAVDPPTPTGPSVKPAPGNPAPVNASVLATHVFASCREWRIADLAEPVMVSCGLHDQASVDARIAEAREIAGLCVAARLPDAASEYVTAGLNTEQVRARLFERVTAMSSAPVSNVQRPQSSDAPTAGGLSANKIYAARRHAMTAKGAEL